MASRHAANKRSRHQPKWRASHHVPAQPAVSPYPYHPHLQPCSQHNDIVNLVHGSSGELTDGVESNQIIARMFSSDYVAADSCACPSGDNDVNAKGFINGKFPPWTITRMTSYMT